MVISTTVVNSLLARTSTVRSAVRLPFVRVFDLTSILQSALSTTAVVIR